VARLLWPICRAGDQKENLFSVTKELGRIEILRNENRH